MKDVDLTQWAWIAGIIEGEGCIVLHKKWNSVKLTVKMTDEDIIRRLQSITGVGKIYYSENKNKIAVNGDPWKPAWEWAVNPKAEVYFVLNNIRKWMGVRRGETIDKALDQLSRCVGKGEEKPIAHGTRRGYHLELKRKIDPCDSCLEAGRAYQRNLYAKNKGR